jgi:hypothetical protein
MRIIGCNFLGSQTQLIPPDYRSHGDAGSGNVRRAAFDSRGAGDHLSNLNVGLNAHGQNIGDLVCPVNPKREAHFPKGSWFRALSSAVKRSKAKSWNPF